MNEPFDFGRVPDQLAKDSRAADKEDRERAELFEAMVKTPGWKLYEALLNQMVEERGKTVLAPAGSVDGAVLLEYEKGTMRGLIIAKDLPQLTILGAKQISAPDIGDES